MARPSAFRHILLNGSLLSVTGGALYLNGSQITGGGGGSVSGDFSTVVFITGDQSLTGVKSFNSPIRVNFIQSLVGNSYIDVGAGALYDVDEIQSIDWQNRNLAGNWATDTNPSSANHLITLSYFNAHNSGAASITNVVHQTGAENISGVKTFFSPITAYSIGSGNRAINFPQSTIFDASNISSVNWGGRTLVDVGNRDSLIWDSRQLLHSGGLISANWQNRTLYDTGEIESVLWAARTLSGNWSTDTIPTISSHIVNKNYLDSKTGLLTGSFYPLNSNPAGYVTSVGSSAIIVANTIFVSKSGNDSTALRERLDKQFLTPSGARNLANTI